jgi:GTPase SAR1 family protein
MSENIKLAIFGPVSAGKTTFFNALMSNKCSGMARKKLTMLPQIYQIVNDGIQIDTIEEIYQKNKASNEEILILREDGEFDQDCHFTELIYNINPIPDFIQLPDLNATYSILDMPGLNCAGDTLYYDYVKKISPTIDIYLVVFDINSGLNTTDEINILKFIVEQIQQNNHGYLHILINKCDNITIDGDNVILEDEELDELYNRIDEALRKYCEPIRDKVSFSPLCSKKLYIYRSVEKDITTIEESYLNDIILDELGKKGLKDYSTITAKREYISGLIGSSTFKDWIKNTGYNQFIHCLDRILRNYSELVFYHINADLVKLQDNVIDEEYFDIMREEIGKINARIQKAKQYTELPIPQYLLDNLEIINAKLNEHLISRHSDAPIDIIDIILDKLNDYYAMLKNVCKSNPLEDPNFELSKNRIKLLIEQFKEEFNEDIFKELHDHCDDLCDYKDSFINTLTKNMNSIIYISDVIYQFDPSEEYLYMINLKAIFVKLLEKNTIDPAIFLQFLPKLIIYAEDKYVYGYGLIDGHEGKDGGLILISKAITNFMITNFTTNEALYTKIICTDWKVLKSSTIEQSGRKIQYIYLSRTFKTFNSVDSIFEKIDYATYDHIMNTLDLIFEILKCHFVDNV